MTRPELDLLLGYFAIGFCVLAVLNGILWAKGRASAAATAVACLLLAGMTLLVRAQAPAWQVALCGALAFGTLAARGRLKAKEE